MIEIWKDLKDYEEGYEISNLGRLRSKTRIIDYTWKKAVRVSKILSNRKNKCGYLYTVLSINKKRKTLTIHRMVATTFIPNPNNYPCVNHIDGNKLNNCVSNLEWCDSSQNISHAYKNGLKMGVRGEKSHYAKLKEEDIINIRNEYSFNNISQLNLGLKYNISQTQISRIIRKENWF
jgi:hypothetical protein